MNAAAGLANPVQATHPTGAAPTVPADAESLLETPYHRLASLPRSTWLPVLTTASGSAAARLAHAAQWLADLDAGALPPAGADFGDGPACAALRAVVGELALPGLTQGVPELAQQVLRTLLWHLDRLVDLQPDLTRIQAIERSAEDFRAAWRVEKAAIEPELALLRQLGDGRHPQWASLRGRLNSREWQAARRAADRLAELPELVALLQRLGRREFSVDPRALRVPQQPLAHQRVPLRAVSTRLPGAPGEITGIRFDSRLEHMLPSEAAWLRHPLLRRLWRARQAEGRLLAHETEAVVVDWRPDPAGRASDLAQAPDPGRLERGPIVLCLDTSGSMQGAPEQVAKAVAIAALRAAHAGRRGCKLVAFGGPGEVLERDLGGAQGLEALLDLMGQAFDGGTDIQTPIERAIACVHEAAWAGADMLVVSDGEFGCVRATLDSLEAARRRLGLRVQGVLIGDRETMGMLEVCDDIHWVRDWRRHADPAAAGERGAARRAVSPVHSKSLTALYFPNALSSFAARHHGAAAPTTDAAAP